MLEQQQECFKGFVKIIMDLTNTRVEATIRDIQEIKTSLQNTQKDVDDIKADNAKQTERCNSVQFDVFKMCDRITRRDLGRNGGEREEGFGGKVAAAAGDRGGEGPTRREPG